MNSMRAVDTNVLLHSVDRHEAVKQLKAQQLLQQLQAAAEPTVLLWQVLGELGQQLRRCRNQGRLSAAEFTLHLQTFRHLFPLVMPDTTVFDSALELSERYSLAHWDSMLLGACRAAGVNVLYTEDVGAPRTIDGIELINPLL
jgi:predicted nucleic acid-binding protein